MFVGLKTDRPCSAERGFRRVVLLKPELSEGDSDLLFGCERRP
jgi:hypothetical protein